MTARLRIAIIGAGGIAQAYRQVFESLDQAVVTVVVDPDHDAAERLAGTLGATTAVEHRALLAGRLARRVDAALVCSPPATHVTVAVDLLAAGRPVLCEKPLAIDVGGAATMAEQAVAAGVPLLMASKFRYVADVARAKALIDDGVIGPPMVVENAFTGRVDMGSRWNSRREISGGGVLIDNGTHSVDIVRYLIGPVAEVLAVEGPRLQGLDVEDTVELFCQTADGVRATADLTWSLDKRLTDYAVVYGTEGTIRLGWSRSVLERPGMDDVVIGPGYDKVAAMREEVIDFLRLVRGAAARITIEDALASVAVIDAGYRSLASTTWQPVAIASSGARPVFSD
jgi:predicted dehydrogenase